MEKFEQGAFITNLGEFNEGEIDAERDAVQRSKLKVLVVEPDKEPYVKEIEAGYRALQQEVDGTIQGVYPFTDPVGIVCNDDGKWLGLPLNRALRDGVFERIRILGVGVQVVAKVELLTDIQIAVFCIAGSISTLFFAYMLVLFIHKIADRKSKVFRAIGFYLTLVFLLLDPLYLSFLYKFVGGGDMNGILLLGIPEIAE